MNRAVTGEFVEHFVSGAECAHGIECVHAVLARKEIADGANTVRKSTENGGAVRHAFVSGDAEFGVEREDGSNSKFRHVQKVAVSNERMNELGRIKRRLQRCLVFYKVALS